MIYYDTRWIGRVLVLSFLSAEPQRVTKAGQWVLRTPLHMRTLDLFSARHGSKNPGSF